MTSSRLPRLLSAVGGAVAIVFVMVPAWALDTDACTAHYESGQTFASDGKLSRARAEFARCIDDSCPSLIRQVCSQSYDDVNERMPSVIFAARTSDGADLVDVAVDVDGVRVSSSLTGKAVDLEPGPHRIRMTSGGVVDDFDLVAREGEKRRTVIRELSRGSPKPASGLASPAPETRGTPWTVYAAGSVALVGLGAFTFFGLRGLDDLHELDDRCGRQCTGAEAQRVKDQFLVADVSLGVALVGAAAAILLFIESRGSPATSTPSAAVVPRRFGVAF